ncbi:MAG: MFS transporter [Candidatus Muirbacterium halophilum]|nr:MFS transporter [Candidatus Muirbacterium halophilum]MCK9476720.1 MFS transporter [Candidatus Muirbacterium halophilum]
MEFENKDYNQVKKARKSFFAIGIAYFMGLFNDNFYKEATVLIAVGLGKQELQAFAMAVFTICYILFTAQSGWFADKYPKGKVIIFAKGIELLAMIAGAFGIWYMNWYLILTMIGIMGAQSALFSPAMNGSIPELYPEWYVQKANTIIKLISTVGFFLGMILAGFVLDKTGVLFYNIPMGRGLVGVFILIAAIIGFGITLWAPKKQACGVLQKFPWAGPWGSIQELIKIKKDMFLWIIIKTNVVIWFIASIMTMLIVNLGKTQYNISNKSIVMMKVVFMTGIAFGGILSNYIAKGKNWYNILSPSLFITGIFLILFKIVPIFGLENNIQIIILFFLTAFTGIAGGVNLIPLESFIQIRPQKNHKGRVIGAANFAVFTAMTLGAGFLFLLNKNFLPTTSFGILGLMTILFSIYLNFEIKKIKE